MANVAHKNKKLMGVLTEVNKAFGKGTIALASQVAFSHLKRIPTGIFSLDVEMGGGAPKGRIILTVGEEGVGKSTLFLLIAANFQHTCKKCLTPFGWYTDEQVDPRTGEVLTQDMVVTQACSCGANEPHQVALLDNEGHFDPLWAASLGVDVATLIVIQPHHGEQGIDVANKLLRTGELDLLGVDSVAMSTPGREVEQGAEGGQRPDLALIWNKGMRTFQASLNSLGMDNPNKPTIYLVNQFREKVGVMYGDPRTWPGGKGQNFAASIIISLRAGKDIDQKGNVGGKDDTKVGKVIHFKTEKNKTFPEHRKGAFKLFNTDVPSLGVRKGDIDNFDQMVAYGAKLGIFKKGGAWYDLAPEFGDEFKNPLEKSGKFQGEAALLTFLKSDPAKAQVVRERIIQAVQASGAGVPTSADLTVEVDDSDDTTGAGE